MIYQNGMLNTTALTVPGLYVDIVPPQNLVINGVPTNVLGVVGSASWGPVGQPVIVGSVQEYVQNFGPVINRDSDAGTAVAVAQQQGANNFRVVRVTDGTETSASVTIAGADFTAKYPGSAGNGISISFVETNSSKNIWRVTITMPNQEPEVFDGLDASTPDNFWTALVNGITNGTGPARGASKIVNANTVPTGTSTAPTAGTTAMSSGTPGSDGALNITAQTLIGSDTAPRTGMYALRGSGAQVAVLAGCTDSSAWASITPFALAEGVYVVVSGPAGESITSAVSNKATAGIDTYAVKVMLGDWLWWYDQANQINRLVSPAAWAAGRLAALSPEQSSLNKQLYGIMGSQKVGLPGTTQAGAYSDADLEALVSAGIDVITNPAPGGAYWAVRIGHNSSSDAVIQSDSYTRLTNYIAVTLDTAMGVYDGKVVNQSLLRRIKASIGSFMSNLVGQGVLAVTLAGNQPFAIVCDASNNPVSRTSLGYVQADVSVQYQAINEKFIVNLEGGASVKVSRNSA